MTIKNNLKQHSISVIIPIYNCETYLEESVRSLLEQTWPNIEYIFIDDASTDNGLKVLENLVSQYPERKQSISIIRHKENKGISFSRLEGVRLSNGEMIIHCDADDVLEKNAYELLMKCAINTNADIIGCGFRIFGDVPMPIISDSVAGNIDSLELLGSIAGSRHEQMHGGLWNKMIRRSLWDEVKIPIDLSYCEDVIALFQILTKRPKVVYINNILYNYRIRKGSLINTKDRKMNIQCNILIQNLECLRSNESQELNSAVDAKIINLLYRLIKSDSLDIESIYSQYKNYRQYINANKQLNLLEKLHLNVALRGYHSAAIVIGKINNCGYKIIKIFRRVK